MKELLLRPIVAIVQARMNSTRLPGKVMRPIRSRPILRHVTERLSRAKLLDEIVVATSVNKTDDLIATNLAEWGVKSYRGSLDDVLDRYYHCAKEFGARTIVRITADCPLIDPEWVDTVIEKFLVGDYDFMGLDETFPDGLDTEIFSFSALKTAWEEARLTSEREHVTPFILKNPDRFRLGFISMQKDRSHMRWTVDDPADLTFVTRVYEALYVPNEIFLTDDILALLDKEPQLAQINCSTTRNEGYKKSLEEDRLLSPVELRKG